MQSARYETVDDDSDFAKRAPSNVGGTPRERLHTGHTQGSERRGGHFFESVEPFRQDGCRKVVVDDITLHNFASILGDSGMSSTSFSSCSETEVAASTISDTESFDHAVFLLLI